MVTGAYTVRVHISLLPLHNIAYKNPLQGLIQDVLQGRGGGGRCRYFEVTILIIYCVTLPAVPQLNFFLGGGRGRVGGKSQGAPHSPSLFCSVHSTCISSTS